MAFTAQDVAKLREQTGAGMMDCKKALTQTDGDMGKAAEYLREQGVNVAAKKASRIAAEGVVYSTVSSDHKKGAMVEINCESDFVAKSDAFVDLCKKVAEIVIASDVKDVEALLEIKIDGVSVLQLINEATAKIGEKISLRRFVKFENAKGLEEAYIHMGGKIGVLLDADTDKDLSGDNEFVTMCHDIAMHIAAFSPKYLYDEEVPASETEHEKEILKAQALNEGKPAAVVEKMIVGRVKKFYKEICLIDQEFAKDATKTIRQLIAEMEKKTGAKIRLNKFERFTMGEGLEKKNEDFAAEIAKLQK